MITGLVQHIHIVSSNNHTQEKIFAYAHKTSGLLYALDDVKEKDKHNYFIVKITRKYVQQKRRLPQIKLETLKIFNEIYNPENSKPL